MSITILGISGSTRSASLNRRVLSIVLEGAESAGATTETVDLRGLNLPLYDGDLESAEGVPENARRLADQIRAADGVVIASPEYNGGYSGVLKNAIDWTSRPDARPDGSKSSSPWPHKVIGLVSASPGSLGGLRGLIPLRMTLAHMGCHVIGDQLGVPEAHGVIGEDGRFTDSDLEQSALGIGRAMFETASRLSG